VFFVEVKHWKKSGLSLQHLEILRDWETF
jgi:hypothetical protein